MGFPIFTLISCILVLILIITTTLAIVFYEERKQAYASYSPWCLTYECNCTSSTPVTGTAAFLKSLTDCQVNPQTGNIDVSKCACDLVGWSGNNGFYNPTDNSQYSNPPANPIPNYCLNST